MKKIIKSNAFYNLLGIILIFLVWLLISSLIKGNSDLIFPSPIATLKEFFRLLTLGSTYKAIGNSLGKMFIGYIISYVLALILGIISGLNKYFNKIFNPFIILLKSVPTASLLFLFIVLSNFKLAPIFVVILVAFPILYESVVGGIKNIPKNINEASKIDGNNHLLTITKIKVPLAFPYILVGLASSFGLAFKVEIMSEILAGPTSLGIGSKIKQIQGSEVSLVGIFAWSLIAIVLMLIISFISKYVKKLAIKHNI